MTDTRTLWTQPWQSSFWTAIFGDVNLVKIPGDTMDPEAVNAPRICAVFTLRNWRFGGVPAKTCKLQDTVFVSHLKISDLNLTVGRKEDVI